MTATATTAGSFDTCQLRGCGRSASGRFTRRMYAAEDDEQYPDDVSDRPVCRYHHWLLISGKAAITGAVFGLIWGIVWLLERVMLT
jgi:hypothetical protein